MEHFSKFDLAWGNTACVREAFLENYNKELVIFDPPAVREMTYPPHYGMESLIKTTRSVIYRQNGIMYPYIILTNGATGAVTISLRAFAQRGAKYGYSNPAPFFPIYPSMFAAAGLEHKILDKSVDSDENTVVLVDSPSNPMGTMNNGMDKVPFLATPIILDAVYKNMVYGPEISRYHAHHDISVGSYSKLLGINGIRIGWIATSDPLLYERLKLLVDGEYCGISDPGMKLLNKLLHNFDWENFERSARSKLDANREEWSKLERFFQGGKVNPVGMFFYGQMDESVKELFTNSGIEWMSGLSCHHDERYGRFNLGQDCVVVREAVKSVIKNDKL